MTESLLERIRAGRLPMRSRSYFILRASAVVFVAILALVLSIFLFNLVLFVLFTGGRAPLLAHGTNGLLVFIRFFPWWVLLADVLLLALLRSLLRQYSFGYRSPTLFFFFGLAVVVGSFGFILYHHTDVNERIEHAAHRGHLPPPVGSFYDDARRTLPDPDAPASSQ
ncbi:MAG: hypothetical protein JWO84_647 [Parcubacteria group bacterium]|nr:hypothetical protein [Parcubacteria group bacterium]